MAKKKTTEKSTKRALPAIKPRGVANFFDRYHAVLFVVTVFGGLAVAIYLLSTLVSGPSPLDDLTNTPSAESTFDSETIERVNQLQPLSDSPRSPEIPSGRIDPF